MKNLFLKTALATSILLSANAFSSSDIAWGYTGDTGPEHWGDLAPEFSTCKTGKNQSPINITSDVEADLDELSISYQTAPTEILNNGHTVQVNIAEGSYFEVDNSKFSLKQYHFHTPSENLVSGESYPLEAHLVHADDQGNLAVIGVFFEYGEQNETLAKLWKQLPTQVGEVNKLDNVATNIEALFPEERDYYRFTGSLTTPPCSEGVRWFVMQDAVSISKQQVEAFLGAVHHENIRPVQAINARKVISND